MEKNHVKPVMAPNRLKRKMSSMEGEEDYGPNVIKEEPQSDENVGETDFWDNIFEVSDSDSVGSLLNEEHNPSYEADDNGWYRISVLPSERPDPFPRFPFLGHTGPTVILPETAQAIEFFELFFDTEVVEYITEATNRYAEQVISQIETKEHSRVAKWNCTSASEIRVFLSILIVQGIIRKPNISMYWSTNSLLKTPFFGTVMGEKRYSLLMKFLQFSDSEHAGSADAKRPKVLKILPLYQLLMQKFKTMYAPERDVAIDETVDFYKITPNRMEFQERGSSHMAMKTVMLREACSGYIWDSTIYTTKGAIFCEGFEDMKPEEKTVMTLMKPLLDQGYCLTADKFYLTPRLAKELINRETDCYGSISPESLDLPKQLFKERLRVGGMVAFHREKIMALRWKGKEELILLSSIHNPELESKWTTLRIPKVVNDYNFTVEGLERVDQQFLDYTMHGVKEHCKKIFRNLIDQAVMNAHVLYKKAGGTEGYWDFRVKIAKGLLEKYQTGRGNLIRCDPSSNPLRLTARHFPAYVPRTERRKDPTRRCVVCCSKRDDNGKRVRRETRYQCVDCSVGLCVAPCFQIYHTVRDY